MTNFTNSRAVKMDEGQRADNSLSVKECLVATLRPRHDDKALSDICIFSVFCRYDEETFITHKFWKLLI